MPETDRSNPSELLKLRERKQHSHPILLDQPLLVQVVVQSIAPLEPWNKTHKAIESKTIRMVLSAVTLCKCTESSERL